MNSPDLIVPAIFLVALIVASFRFGAFAWQLASDIFAKEYVELDDFLIDAGGFAISVTVAVTLAVCAGFLGRAIATSSGS